MAGMVIIGGGLAGGRAARALREEGYEGDVTIVAGEPHFPYQRPPLSKGYLSGKEDEGEVFLKPDEWYTENKVTVLTGDAAASISPAEHTVTLASGATLSYDKLLLATGARARSLPIEGADLTGVYSLRTLNDSRALHAELADGGKNLVLIGSGWIGMEVAATASSLGNKVTVLEREGTPLSAVLSENVGKAFQRMHEEHGVVFKTRATVESIVGEGGKVTGVVADGVTISADLVLVGVGAIPNTEIAEAAGLQVMNGVVTDNSLRTSDADIYAAGDIANVFYPAYDTHIRSEHWDVANGTGKQAAKAMLGQEVAYDAIPYFFTDQYDLGMELSGIPHLMRDAEVIVRGDLENLKFVSFWVNDGKVVAGMNVNVWDVNDKVQELIRSGKAVDVDKLQDPETPLESLV